MQLPQPLSIRKHQHILIEQADIDIQRRLGRSLHPELHQLEHVRRELLPVRDDELPPEAGRAQRDGAPGVADLS